MVSYRCLNSRINYVTTTPYPISCQDPLKWPSVSMISSYSNLNPSTTISRPFNPRAIHQSHLWYAHNGHTLYGNKSHSHSWPKIGPILRVATTRSMLGCWVAVACKNKYTCYCHFGIHSASDPRSNISCSCMDSNWIPYYISHPTGDPPSNCN